MTRSRALPIVAVVAAAARGDEFPLLHCLGLDPVQNPQVSSATPRTVLARSQLSQWRASRRPNSRRPGLTCLKKDKTKELDHGGFGEPCAVHRSSVRSHIRRGSGPQEYFETHKGIQRKGAAARNLQGRSFRTWSRRPKWKPEERAPFDQREWEKRNTGGERPRALNVRRQQQKTWRKRLLLPAMHDVSQPEARRSS